MEHRPNPFTNRGAITDLRDFHGRSPQCYTILSRLKTMQSSSVVGERRIGKSSLLYCLKAMSEKDLGDNYRVFYLDLQDARFHTAVGFLRRVLEVAGASADRIHPAKGMNKNLIGFSEELDMLYARGERIVLCLDEFEAALRRQDEYPDDFFEHMRSQLQVGKIAFVTATQQSLLRLYCDELLTSPFHNIFTPISLTEFTEDEASGFVAIHHKTVRFSDAELHFIAANLQRHPLELQIECDWVMRNRQARLSERNLAKRIASEYQSLFPGRYNYRRILRLKANVDADKALKAVRYIVDMAKMMAGSE